MVDRCPSPSGNQNGSRIWTRGDLCRVKWSGDNEIYKAIVRKIVRQKDSFNIKALVHFDGFTSEDDEEVEIEDLQPLVTKRPCSVDSPTPGPSGQANVTSDKSKPAKPLMFSASRADEEQDRLSQKYRLWEEEEEASVASTPVRRNSWKTKSRSLMDKLSTPSPKKTPPKRKAAVVQLIPRKSKTDNDSKVTKSVASASHKTPDPRKSVAPLTASSKKKSDLSLHLSESDEETDDPRHLHHSGFDDADLEKPRLKHKAKFPKVSFVVSGSEVDKEVAIPATINQYLFEYQREGVRFLYNRYKSDEGAILGDDMGLGKTVQVIAFLSALLGKTGTKIDVLKMTPKFIRRLSSEDYDSDEDSGERKTYLIIGPASVLYNWVDELETWGHFSVGKFHKNFKQQTLSDLDKDKLDVVLTTYETCRDHLRDLNRHKWDAVIADEAHKIKGMKAEITQALKALKCRRRYGLTGTALQNHMKELWCLFDWANPGCLGTVHQFEEKFEKVMMAGQKQDATKRQLAEARKAKEMFSALKSKWFLRRTKTLIADQLPQKHDQVVYCRPTAFQLDVYKGILSHPDIQLILRQKEPCPCKSDRPRGKCHYKKSEDGRSVNQLTFSYLHMLMKTANHVALLMPENTSNKIQRRQAEDICKVAFAKHPQFREQTQQAAFRTLSDPKYCGKMKVLAGLLKVFKKENSKVLLFSLSTQLLDIIEQYVVTTGYEYRRLDGKVPEVKRVQLVHEFNKNPGIFLFLSSTKAGGVGLNLTGANVVIIYDPNWNPTHDLQAQDRAYRLGQGRDVRVYRLITMGTIEENIYLRQIFKQQLDSMVVSEQNAKRLFYENEIKGVANMFKLRSSDKCLTMDILERNEKIETSIRGFTVARYIPPTPSKNLLEDTEEDEKGDDEDVSSDDEEYGESQHLMEDSEFSVGSHSSESENERKPKRTQKQTQHGSTQGPKSNSSSQFSDVIACKQNSPSAKKSSEPTAGTSRESGDGRGSKRLRRVHYLSSSDEEGEEKGRNASKIIRQQSTLAISDSVASVTDVFEHYGIPHTHENKKLIGASKAEDHMTKCAIEDVYELNQYSQVPAAFCQPCSQSSEESEDIGKVCERKKSAPVPPVKDRVKAKPVITKGACSMVIEDKKVLLGQTPSAIRRKQFEQMAVFANIDKVTLAKAILTSPQEDQEEFLKRFYVSQDEKLAGVFIPEQEEEETSRKPAKGKAKKSVGKNRPQKRTTREKPKAKGCEYQSESEEEDDRGETVRKRKTNPRKRRLKQRVISSDSEENISHVIPKSDVIRDEEESRDVESGAKPKSPPDDSESSSSESSSSPPRDILDEIFVTAMRTNNIPSSSMATPPSTSRRDGNTDKSTEKHLSPVRARRKSENDEYLKSFTKTFMEELLGGSPTRVKTSPAKSEVKSPKQMVVGSPEPSTSESSSMAKQKKPIPHTSTPSNSYSILQELGIVDEEGNFPKKRKKSSSDTQSRVNSEMQSSDHEDNSLDLFSRECKVTSEASVSHLSDWESELNAVSPRKKQR